LMLIYQILSEKTVTKSHFILLTKIVLT